MMREKHMFVVHNNENNREKWEKWCLPEGDIVDFYWEMLDLNLQSISG